MQLTRLRAIRLDQALSMQELSNRSGVSKTTIVRAETGAAMYTTTVRKLAKALGVTPAELRGSEPVTVGYDAAPPRAYPGPGVGNPNLTPAAGARRAATAARPPSAGLAHALAEAERCRRADDLAGAERWEQIAAGIAAALGGEANG